MTNKRGQAALEFLSTYAWAFIVILIVLGALAYFGVTNPERFLPDRCSLNPEIGCGAYLFSTAGTDAGTLTMQLQNNAGSAIAITNFNLISDNQMACTAALDNTSWPAGVPSTFTFTACNDDTAGVTQGDKVRLQIEYDWYTLKAGSTFSRRGGGEIVTTAN